MTTRAELIQRLRNLRDEIRQQFTDADHWNRIVRPLRYPDAQPINPDPHGDLQRLLDRINHVLDHDKGHGPIEPLDFQRVH